MSDCGADVQAYTTHKEVTAPIWDAPVRIPLPTGEEVACIVKEPLLHPGVQDDGAQGPLRACRHELPITGTVIAERKQ